MYLISGNSLSGHSVIESEGQVHLRCEMTTHAIDALLDEINVLVIEFRHAREQIGFAREPEPKLPEGRASEPV
jgi:hypothetical protein